MFVATVKKVTDSAQIPPTLPSSRSAPYPRGVLHAAVPVHPAGLGHPAGLHQEGGDHHVYAGHHQERVGGGFRWLSSISSFWLPSILTPLCRVRYSYTYIQV